MSDSLAALQRSGNLLLKTLTREERIGLASGTDVIDVESNAVIFERDQRIDALYFPEDMLARVGCAGQEQTIESGVVGREGMLGWSILLGGHHSAHRVVADINGGKMLRVQHCVVAACPVIPGGFREALYSFIHVLMVQMAHQAVAAAAESLDRRLAIWLLMRHDRSAGDELRLQHIDIAASIGARRASITECLHKLEGERLIRSRRGSVIVRDRAALEAFAGHWYGAPERLYRDQIGPFGKTFRTASSAAMSA